jgi:Protein of unknown function (DUF2555)
MATLTLESLDVAKLTQEEVNDLAARLELDDYASAFDCLNDWHLLRAIAFQRPELVEHCYYLLDMQSFDES